MSMSNLCVLSSVHVALMDHVQEDVMKRGFQRVSYRREVLQMIEGHSVRKMSSSCMQNWSRVLPFNQCQYYLLLRIAHFTGAGSHYSHFSGWFSVHQMFIASVHLSNVYSVLSIASMWLCGSVLWFWCILKQEARSKASKAKK